MNSDELIEFREEDVPVEGIRETIEEVLDLFGAEMESKGPGLAGFTLPRSRGIAASGRIACTIEWATDMGEKTTLTLRAGREIAAPRFQQIAILSIGAIGAVLGLLWPFFPSLSVVSAVGFVLAFATYFLTLRRVPGGVAAEILQKIARAQRDSETERE